MKIELKHWLTILISLSMVILSNCQIFNRQKEDKFTEKHFNSLGYSSKTTKVKNKTISDTWLNFTKIDVQYLGQGKFKEEYKYSGSWLNESVLEIITEYNTLDSYYSKIVDDKTKIQLKIEYDSTKNCTIKYYEKWENDSWVNLSKCFFEINMEENKIVETRQNWIEKEWIDYERIIHEFEVNRNVKSVIWQNWVNKKWESIFEHKQNLTSIDDNFRLYENWNTDVRSNRRLLFEFFLRNDPRMPNRNYAFLYYPILKQSSDVYRFGKKPDNKYSFNYSSKSRNLKLNKILIYSETKIDTIQIETYQYDKSNNLIYQLLQAWGYRDSVGSQNWLKEEITSYEIITDADNELVDDFYFEVIYDSEKNSLQIERNESNYPLEFYIYTTFGQLLIFEELLEENQKILIDLSDFKDIKRRDFVWEVRIGGKKMNQNITFF